MLSVPVISVVGRQNAGKTLLVSQMVRYWRDRGVKAGVIKHDGHACEGIDWEKPGSDTERFGEAGAVLTMVAGGGQSLMRLHDDPFSDNLEALIRRVARQAESDVGSGLDIIIAEGFKRSNVAKLVVVQDVSDVAWIQELPLHPIFAIVGPKATLDDISLPWKAYDAAVIPRLCEDLWNDASIRRLCGSNE